jgi:chromosome segregation ATPase
MIPTVAMSFQQLSAKVREVYLNTRAEIEAKDAEIAALKANAPVAELEAKITELEAKAAEHKERDARVKRLVDNLMALKDANAAQIAELAQKNGELALKCAELESRTSGMQAQLSAAMEDKAQLEHQVQNLIDTVADLATHNEDLAADFDDMEQRASLAEDDNIELVASIKVLESIVTASEHDLDQWKAAQAHFAGRLAETEGFLHQADERRGKAVLATPAPAPTDEPASKKRRRGDGSLRREFTYDHVSVADGKLMFKIADAEHPATEAKLRYVDVITATGRSYNRYYLVRDGKEKMCRSRAEVERAFGVTPTRKYSRASTTA